MFDDAELYNRSLTVQEGDAHKLLDCVITKMCWTDDDIVMDIGCGSGNSARNILLPRIPKLKRLLGIDVLPGMIKFAKSEMSHEKIEYHVADVENWSTLQKWQGIVTKAFSVHSFHWLNDKKQAFENVFRILVPDGEAAFTFCISLSLWDIFPIVLKEPKWSIYLKDFEDVFPTSYCSKNGKNYYLDMLQEIEFEVITCTQENRRHALRDDSECRRVFQLLYPFYSWTPEDKREEFLDDLFDRFIAHYGRDPNGKPEIKYTTLDIHVRKIQAKQS